uniref:Uncharacterized protein n=1 Tax=Megaviridae environmental sample TaxID=1737588 RepID=A0A5J6VJB0_9VIRU|nr:MAG: hypothetical protein [Megaviridae environmental sample]
MYQIINFKNFDKKGSSIRINREMSCNYNYVFVDEIRIPHINNNSKINHILNPTKTVERLINIDFYQFYHSINKSFHSWNAVEEQFHLDIMRSSCYVNQHEVHDPQQALDYIMQKYPTNITRMIAVFSTQAVFAIPFEIIQQNITDIHEDYYLMELHPNDIKNNPLLKKSLDIDIIPMQDNVIFSAFKQFKVYDISNLKTKYYISIHLHTRIPASQEEPMVGMRIIISPAHNNFIL